jgi:hypothetical protein
LLMLMLMLVNVVVVSRLPDVFSGCVPDIA